MGEVEERGGHGGALRVLFLNYLCEWKQLLFCGLLHKTGIYIVYMCVYIHMYILCININVCIYVSIYTYIFLVISPLNRQLFFKKKIRCIVKSRLRSDKVRNKYNLLQIKYVLGFQK